MKKLIDQIMPVVVCLVLFAIFVLATKIFIVNIINPFSLEKTRIQLLWPDIIAGFLLYFFTAIDYALVVGRMQTVNTGLKARFIMNVFTCIGCFVGVSLVLFLWGFVKEVAWLIIPLLVFAGSVMIRLAYEGTEYFNSKATKKVLHFLYIPTKIYTHWMPEMNKPVVNRMSPVNLMKWSFLLPFIIGIDDLVGYMGAMTIYNAFSLIFGIYIADIVIDILIFISPSSTTKIVNNHFISFLGTIAFLFLAYKSFSEAITVGLKSSLPVVIISLGILGIFAIFSVYRRKVI